METNSNEEQRCLLTNQNNTDLNSSEEEWSDEISNDSYYSDTDSSVPEWESSVHDTTGELMFIDCHPFVTQNIDSTRQKEPSKPLSRNQLRHSTRGKFLRLIRRRESQRHSRRYQKTRDATEATTNKVKFHDSQEGEEKEVVLKINCSSHKQEHLSLSEQLLGISVGTLSDGNRVMIAGFLPDSEAKHEKNIKIGDWLKSINNVTVIYQNINQVLYKLVGKTEILLKLQRVAGVEVTKDPPINELNCQSQFVQELISFNKEDEHVLLEKLCQYPIGILYLNLEKLNESNSEHEDVIYCYPRPLQQSILCQSRGMFITLNHLINEITKTKLQISVLLHKDNLCYVTYSFSHGKLFLFMLPDGNVSINEALLMHSEIVRTLRFVYETLDKCFAVKQHMGQVDAFFARYLIKVINKGVWTTSSHIGNKDLHFERDNTYQTEFERILPAAATLYLPNEAYVQLDEALTELEASDYREWNEEPLDCQRLFTILGSAVYHCGHLLASHLAYGDLIDVDTYCRVQGLFHLCRTEPIKTLVLWKEVFPHSCNRNEDTHIKIPMGKRYLLVVGSRKDLLAVIMEAGGCTEPAEENMGPDAFYVEETQATLAHIQELGISELASRWLSSNPGTQVTIPETCNKRKLEFMDNLSRSVSHHKEPKTFEVTSILKRRNSDQTLVTHSSSFYSLAEEHCDVHSEDSSSQGGQSEISDDNVISKKDKNAKFDSNDEHSDVDDYGEGSQLSSSSFDISELRQTILSETEDFQPQQLSSGKDNVLFHFVQFDLTEGILVSPPECRVQSKTMECILQNFRKSCHKIHSLFQNTMRFKTMPTQDMAKSVMNKSLIAIKEYGIKFECPFLDDADNRKNQIKYWVVGRLFYMPHPKEVYVCYQDNIPQNIIELAFKIDLSTMN